MTSTNTTAKPIPPRLRRPPTAARRLLVLARGLTPAVRQAGSRLRIRLRPLLGLLAPEGDQPAGCLEGEARFAPLARAVCLTVAGLLLFAGLGHHIFRLQITRHDALSAKAQKLYTRVMVQQGQRGKIFDLSGNLLAGNIAVQNIYAEPKRFGPKHYQAITTLLADSLGLNYHELDRRFQTITKHEHICICIQDFVETAMAHRVVNAALPGVMVEPSEKATGLFKVTFRPAQAGRLRHEVATSLSHTLGVPYEDIENQILRALNRPYEIVVQKHVDYGLACKLKAVAETQKYKGLRFEEGYVRTYPLGSQLANLIGFLDHNGKGVSGIEALFDEHLQPTPGKIQFERDGSNRMIPQSAVTMSKPRNGADIYLTIQQPLQQIAEEELMKMVAVHQPRRAYIIMMNPKTGAIMAFAQYPSFNPNDRGTMTDGSVIQPHALLTGFEPGSIMKAVSVSAAMELRPIEPDSVYYCEKGAWRYGGRTLHDSSGSRFEDLTVSEIIKKSSNIGTAKIALELEERELYQSLLDFGFGRRTGIGFIPATGEHIVFSNEAHGSLSGVDQWSKVSMTRIPIGQGVLCTPMQMVQAYGPLANHGIMMQPYVVAKIVSGDTTRYSSPQVKGQPIQPETARKMTSMLKGVTTKGGTGTKAAVPGFAVAGKTGTAQKWISDLSLKAKGYYSHRDYDSSFIGYVPADNPEFVLLVTADSPSTGSHYGGTVCGPAFSQTSERSLRYLQVQPTESQPSSDTATLTDAHGVHP